MTINIDDKIFNFVKILEKRRNSLILGALTEHEHTILNTEFLFTVNEISKAFNIKFNIFYLKGVPYIKKHIKVNIPEFPNIPKVNYRCVIKYNENSK